MTIDSDDIIESEEEKDCLIGKISKECKELDFNVDWSGVIIFPRFLGEKGLEKSIASIGRIAKEVIQESEKYMNCYNPHYVPFIKKITSNLYILDLSVEGLVKK